MNAIDKARNLYTGGLIASAMANSLFEKSGLDHPCNSEFRRKALIGKALRSLSQRQQGEKFARIEAERIANWSGNDTGLQFRIDMLKQYKMKEKTGLDPFNLLNERRDSIARLMREIRRLKNDGKRLTAQALAILDYEGIDRIVLLNEAMTVRSYEKWAIETLKNYSN